VKVLLLLLAVLGDGVLVRVEPPEWNFGAATAGEDAVDRS
jgi:hypothetical protein